MQLKTQAPAHPPSCQAAVYVIEEYFSMNPEDSFINVTMKAGSAIALGRRSPQKSPTLANVRRGAGQSLSAFLASLAHAQPFAFGLTDAKVPRSK